MQRANSIFDSDSETRMFHQIAGILPEGYRLLPQVPLRSFVNNWIYDNLPFPHKRWLCQCSVDYAVCIDNVYLTRLSTTGTRMGRRLVLSFLRWICRMRQGNGKRSFSSSWIRWPRWATRFRFFRGISTTQTAHW